MSRKKKKTNKRAARRSQRRAVVTGGEPKMSEVILNLVAPLLDGDVSDPKVVDRFVQLTIAAWNKAMLPADRQAATEKKVIDILVRADGDAEQVAAVIQAMEIVDERRRKLFPNLRRFVSDYDLHMSEGRLALNIVSESMSGP